MQYIVREYVQGISLVDFFKLKILQKYCHPQYEELDLEVPIKTELSARKPFRIQANLPTAIILQFIGYRDEVYPLL